MNMENLYLGTQGWSYTAWVGSFYPAGARQTAWLPYYSTQFNTVELDTTFYALPRESTIDGWREKTPEGFIFSAKFPKVITHEKILVDCQMEAHAFIQGMDRLGDKLGPLLLQMPPSFAASAYPDLAAFLEILPSGFRYVLEVRHQSWLKGGAYDQLRELLSKHKVALCLVQHAWMPALDVLTGDFAYIRWLGRREDIPDDDYSAVRIDRDQQLDRWSEQIGRYLRAGVTVHGYFNNHYMGHSPASVRALQARLTAEAETDSAS